MNRDAAESEAGSGRATYVPPEFLCERSERIQAMDARLLAKRLTISRIIASCRSVSLVCTLRSSSLLRQRCRPIHPRGSATQVMLATQFRAPVGQKHPMRRPTSSHGHPRRVSRVWIATVQEERPYSQRQTEPPVQSMWTPVCSRCRRASLLSSAC